MPLYDVYVVDQNGEQSGPLQVTADSIDRALAHALPVRNRLRFTVDAKQLQARASGSSDQLVTRTVEQLTDWMVGKPGPYGVSVLNPNIPYEDDNFVEEHRLPHVNRSTGDDDWMFIFRHKASENVFRTPAKDRHELAAKIDVGDYEDADRRNTGFSERNLGGDEDQTDE